MRIPAIGLAALCLTAIISAQQPPAPPSRFDRGASITMLRQIKADLKAHYYDTSFRGMDVDAVFTEAESRLRVSASHVETSTILADVLMRLNDSHTMYYPPERVTRVDYGWTPGMIGDEPFVRAVTAGSDAEKKGLRVGDRILFWNRYEPSRGNLWQLIYLYNFVRPQAMQRIVVRKPDGTTVPLDIESKQEQRRSNQLSDLLEEIISTKPIRLDREQTVGDTMVWRYSSFGDPKAVERAVKKARAAKSLVLDLRGNGGGAVDTLRAMVSHLFDRDVHVATEIGRKGEKRLDARGRKDAFTGPLVVLVDSDSGSAAEMLARIVQIEKRGRVIGDRTAGAVMTARMFPHTVGIAAVAFYATTITIGDVRMSDGGSLEHKGVTPDEVLLPSGADLAAKRDPLLAHAIALLGGTITPEQAGALYPR